MEKKADKNFTWTDDEVSEPQLPETAIQTMISSAKGARCLTRVMLRTAE